MPRLLVTWCAALAIAAPAPARAFGLSFQGTAGRSEAVRDVDTRPHLVFGAILGLHFDGPLALEVEYQHGENDVEGTSGAGTLTQDGLLGHVRLDLVRGPLTPFLYGGVGWMRLEGSTAALAGTHDRTVVPAGAGLELRLGPIVLGVRGEYQWSPTEIEGRSVDFWKAVGTVGLRAP